MAVPIKNNISRVGKVDWELRAFHGEEFSTHKGTSCNSYLVQEEKAALIETVWAPFAKEFVLNLQQKIDLSAIDYVIANHGEIDHSGALPELMRLIPEIPDTGGLAGCAVFGRDFARSVCADEHSKSGNA